MRDVSEKTVWPQRLRSAIGSGIGDDMAGVPLGGRERPFGQSTTDVLTARLANSQCITGKCQLPNLCDGRHGRMRAELLARHTGQQAERLSSPRRLAHQ